MNKLMRGIGIVMIIVGLLSILSCGEDEENNSSSAPKEGEVTTPYEEKEEGEVTTPYNENYEVDFQGLGNTPSNIMAGSYAVSGGGYIYYVDQQNGGNLWKMSLDGEGSQVILEGQFKHLNLSGEWLVANMDYESDIVAFKTDGSKFHTILEGSYAYPVVKDNMLFYVDFSDGGIYKSNLKGENSKKIADEVWTTFSIAGDYVYYLKLSQDGERYEINRVDFNGEKEEMISPDNETIEVGTFTLDEEWFYYALWKSVDGQSHTYKMNLETLEVKHLPHLFLRSPNIWNQVLFYKQHYPSAFVKNDLDGQEAEVILEASHFFDVCVVEGWIFFFNNHEEKAISMMTHDGQKLKYGGYFEGQARQDE